MRKTRFDFAAEVQVMLLRLGAQATAPGEFILDTQAGPLHLKPFDNWVATRFDDVARAVALAPDGSLNRYSGKWNWHFLHPSATDVAYLETRLRKVMPASGAVQSGAPA